MKPSAIGSRVLVAAGAFALCAASGLASPGPVLAGLTLWGRESIKISGNDNSFCGWAHSNGSVQITGQDNVFSAQVEYVDTFRSNDHNAVMAVQTSATSTPMPPRDLEAYRALALAEGLYFAGDADLDLATLGGLVFAEGAIHISGSGIVATVTLVSAGGEIRITGSGNDLTAAVDDVLIFAAGGDGAINGSHSALRGRIFVPNGDFSRHGADDSVFAGPVVAATITWSGSRNHLGGTCCVEDGECDDADSCTADECHAGACRAEPIDGCVSCSTDADCSDADACNGAETCADGTCRAGAAPSCDDGDGCTQDGCDPAVGCVRETIQGCRACTTSADCNDADPCTADECDAGICSWLMVPRCEACVTATDCADGDPCTEETCTAVGVCERLPKPGCIACDTKAECVDEDPCTIERCGVDGSCVFTVEPGCFSCRTTADCADGDPCTDEICAEGICGFSPSEACPACEPEVCDDGADNDCDGLTDCADVDCAQSAACRVVDEVCGDCLDNDGNGLVDYEDPACCETMVQLGLQKLELRPSGRGRQDRIRLQSQYSAQLLPGFDPLIHDTSIQLSDPDGVIFCTTVTADHWMVRRRRHLAFWDRKGEFSGGLSDGRFTVARGGRVLFRTHGTKTPLRTLGEGAIRVTVRTGGVCSQTEATLRARKAALIAP